MKYYIIRYENGKSLYCEFYHREDAEEYAAFESRGWSYEIEEFWSYEDYLKHLPPSADII